MTITLNGTTGITTDGGYTGDGISFADGTPSNTLVTTTGGNVGIGTNSPVNKLNLYSASDVYQRWQNSATGITSSDGFQLGIGSVGEVYQWQYENQPIVFATNNTERMRIDSSGRVTMPYQPSFHVRVNNYAWIQTSPIPWSQAVYDVGSNFNLSTYRFTAPIAGKYFFIAQVLCHSQTSEYAAIFLRKNGSNVTYSEVANSTVNNNNTKHITAVLNLSANDYIDFAFDASGGDYYGGNQETNLYGWLLG